MKVVFHLFLVTTGCLFLFFLNGCGGGPEPVRVRVYAGAGLRPAMDELAQQFEQESGIVCEIDYGGSGMIISRAKEDTDADLFIPGDLWYVERLHELTGIIEEKRVVAYFVPVIIVQKGNPKKIKGIDDFVRSELQVALGNPEACQVGRISMKILANAGIDPDFIPAKSSLTVNELGLWVKMKDVDAAIVWDAIAANIADAVDTIEIPPEVNEISTVVAGLMKSSQHPEEARKFVSFMRSPAGKTILSVKGYQTEPPKSDLESP